MSQSKSTVKSVLMIMFFTLGSKLLGFVRDALIAAKFGSGSETDTFFVALTAITLFSTMLIRAINTTMVPILNDIESKDGWDKKKHQANNLLNFILLISCIIMIVGMILAPAIIKILAFGFEGEQFKLAVLLMRIGLPVLLFSGIVGVFRGYLQTEFMFTETAITQFPHNIVYIVFLLFFSSVYGIKGLMVASVLAVASQIIVQMPGVTKTGFKYKFHLNINNKYIKKLLYLSVPVLISAVINDINKIVDKSLASTLVEGSISALDFADRIQQLIYGVFIMAITTVIFPMLSVEVSQNNYEALKRIIRNGINIIILITIPATIGIIILAKPIVSLAFERGAFTASATVMTSQALIFYTIGLVAISLRSLLYRVYYALQDTRTPMINSFIAVGINIILNFILINYMAHNGLALATSISAIMTTLFLLYNLKRKIGKIGINKLIKCVVKSLFASAIMGVAVYLQYNFMEHYFSGNLLLDIFVLFFSAVLGVIIYLLIIYLIKVEELYLLIKLLRKKYVSS